MKRLVVRESKITLPRITRLGSERLTGALLDRLTHHVSILTMNGESYRLKQSTENRPAEATAEKNQDTGYTVDPDTGEITET